jgi:hypothetical protein
LGITNKERAMSAPLIETIVVDPAGWEIKIYDDRRIELELRHSTLGEAGKCLSLWLPDAVSEVLLTLREQNGDELMIATCMQLFQPMVSFNHAMAKIFHRMNEGDPAKILDSLRLLTTTNSLVAERI